MIYGRMNLTLQQALPREKRFLLAAQICKFPEVRAVTVDESAVRIWYTGRLQLAAIQKLAIAAVHEAKEAAITPKERLAGFRRDAIASMISLAAVQLVKHSSPEIFAMTKVVRSALVMFLARHFIQNGTQGLLQEHRPNADTLTTTAVIASILAGKPESSLTLLTLSNGAEMLTSYAAEKARTQISGLLSMDQRYVWRVSVDGAEQKVPVEQIQAGDTIAAHTGEKIVIDGKVVAGSATVNQASITGESAPAMKHGGSSVYAGSVVEAGELVIRMEKVGKDTSLAHIVHLVEEAQNRRAPVQNFADQMANFLVPVSFLGAAIVYGATRDIQRVLNLLFIDFSCGLKLSTATAISAAISAAAKRGILVKGGNYIEALADTDTVVLDKTGTLTVGVPQISFLRTSRDVEEKEMLLLAASAEMHSVHPLAVAIQKYVKREGWKVPQYKSDKTIVGRGMAAEVPDFETYKGGFVRVGSRKFLTENGIRITSTLTEGLEGRNLIYVARDKKVLGVIGIEDPERPKMKKTLNQMRRIGVDEIVMLTGDSKEVAREVARKMDIDSYHAEILPEDKSNYVNQLKQRGTVMMVGDGINDTPALAFADVGVSLGGRQTDIAAESSAVTIHSEDPEKLMEALTLGRRTMHLVQQNFTATLLVNSAAMLLGALGKIIPLYAAIIHNSATLAVVLNSCRILRCSFSQGNKEEYFMGELNRYLSTSARIKIGVTMMTITGLFASVMLFALLEY